MYHWLQNRHQLAHTTKTSGSILCILARKKPSKARSVPAISTLAFCERSTNQSNLSRASSEAQHWIQNRSIWAMGVVAASWDSAPSFSLPLWSRTGRCSHSACSPLWLEHTSNYTELWTVLSKLLLCVCVLCCLPQKWVWKGGRGGALSNGNWWCTRAANDTIWMK